MKKSTTFIFTIVLLLIMHAGLSNAFFMPDYEKKPRYEQIPDLKNFQRYSNKNKRKKSDNNSPSKQLKFINKNYEIERYALVDGVFTPVYKKKEIVQKQPSDINNSERAINSQVIKVNMPSKNNVVTNNETLGSGNNFISGTVEDQEKIATNDLESEVPLISIDSSAPKYQHIYNQ